MRKKVRVNWFKLNAWIGFTLICAGIWISLVLFVLAILGGIVHD